jgi:hypothetical protein
VFAPEKQIAFFGGDPCYGTVKSLAVAANG